ncbi:MAG: CopG family transcriptional regulator [Vicinamibacterales bacterium]
MVRTQIQLTDAQAQALKALGVAEGKSMAELIRDGVDTVLRARGTVDREAVKARSLAAVGRFKSSVRDLGSKHDDHLADAFGA